jgi:hypothetical protein
MDWIVKCLRKPYQALEVVPNYGLDCEMEEPDPDSNTANSA